MAVTEISFSVISPTRDECVAEMDKLAFDVQNMIGGDPWVLVDDDIQRRCLGANPLDADSYAYFGSKKLAYTGPHHMRPSEGMPPGVSFQHTDKEKRGGTDDNHQD